MSNVSLINGHIDGADTCVICGREIPEGSQVCVICGKTEPRDLVEVVRCKDCKWYQEGKIFAPNKFCFRLKHPTEDRKIGYNYSPDDFCSYGERRG